MDNDQYIQEFLNSENPSKEVFVNAFVSRDNFYNIDTRETREKHLKKLGYTLEKINAYKARKQNEFVTNVFQTSYQNFLNENQNVPVNFDVIINSYQNSADYKLVENKVQKDLERFNTLSNLLDSSNAEFYQALTIGELSYLGW